MTSITENTRITTNLKMIFSFGSALLVVLLAWVQISLKLSTLDTANTSNQKDIAVLRAEIEKNRTERIKSMEELRTENNFQHATLSSGQDRIINILLNKGQ